MLPSRSRLIASFPKQVNCFSMAPKRQSSTATPSTPNSKGKGKAKEDSKPETSNKKLKTDHSKQSSLTSFFGSNSPQKKTPEKLKASELSVDDKLNVASSAAAFRNGSNKGKTREKATGFDEVIIDVDALTEEELLIDQDEKLQIQRDADFARSMQEEWNTNESTTQSNPNPNPNPLPSSSTSKSNLSPLNENKKPIAPLFRPKEEKKPILEEKPRPSSSNISNASPIQQRSFNTTTSSPNKSKPISFDFNALEKSISKIPLSEDIFKFDPSLVDTSSWPRAISTSTEPTTPYALLTSAFVMISSTKSRLIITTVLTNVIRTIRYHDRENLLASVYLVSNHIAPAYDGIELGLGGAITNKVLKEVTGISAQKMKALWNKSGDPGDVAYEAKKDIKPLVQPPPITVQKLFSTLHSIAGISGTGSGAQKGSLVSKLLVASRGEETRFLVRTLHANLRISAVKTTIATSLARAFTLLEQDGENPSASSSSSVLISPKERIGILANPFKAKERSDTKRLAVMEKISKAERMVREVRARHPNFSTIVPALLEHGIDELSKRVPLSIGTPISPMLGSITRSLDAMHTKLGSRAFCSEFKYDGQRCQIHAQWFPEPSDQVRKELASISRGKWTGSKKDVFVRLFSRHLEDQTSKYPDICDLVPLLLGADIENTAQDSVQKEERKVQSFIMDAEIVAVGLEGELLPFQTLTNRSRKDVDLGDIKVKVGVFAFDLMYLDGNSLLKMSFRGRRKLLHSRFPLLDPINPLIAKFNHVKSLESNDPEEVSAFFELARASKCEGIMVKSLDHHWETSIVKSEKESSSTAKIEEEDENENLVKLEKLDDIVDDELEMEEDDQANEKASTSSSSKIDLGVGKGVNGRGKALLSTYEPDKRCESWLKVKKDYVDGIGDSLDLVPIGAWHGMGRKAAWWSPILLAVYDEQSGVYQAVCKCISGFTDAEYKSLRFQRFVEGSKTCYDARTQPCRESYDTGGLLPDVWFEPVECWEVRGADITLSPNYKAAQGLVSAERGLSMRFPRFIKRRTDKGPMDSTTPKQLAKLYLDQNSSNVGEARDGKKLEDRRDEEEGSEEDEK